LHEDNIVKKTTNNTLAWIAILGVSTGCSTMNQKPSAPPVKDKPSLSEVVPTKIPPSTTGNPESYVVFGKRYYVDKTSEGYRENGTASWYGSKFHGRKTSSGAIFNMYDITAAHRSLPIPSYARVTHLGNGRSLIVKINDRGPFAHNRIIDLSYAAAKKLGMIKSGTARVEVLALPPYQYLPGNPPPKAALAQADPALTPKRLTSSDQAMSPPTPRSDAHTPDATSVARPGRVTPVYIQVGAFSNRDNAEFLKNRLASHLNHPVLVEASQNQWYKVRVGPFDDSAEAEQVTGRLTDLGIGSKHFIFN
jgi:rare lipoprotein A